MLCDKDRKIANTAFYRRTYAGLFERAFFANMWWHCIPFMQCPLVGKLKGGLVRLKPPKCIVSGWVQHRGSNVGTKECFLLLFVARFSVNAQRWKNCRCR